MSPAAYQIATVQLPPNYTATYIDRGYWFMSVPAQYVGLPFIRTAAADRNNRSDAFLTFNVNKPVTLYVLYSADAVTGPNWLEANFTPTGEQVTRNYHTFTVWQQQHAPLGQHHPRRKPGRRCCCHPGTLLGMYVVIIEEE